MYMEKQITMKLPEDMYKDLRELSSKKGNIPLGDIIRRAIDDYLRKNRMKGNL
jgi:metal-responsive CopG/Arc/MetJ family transcriptional regulator